MVKHNPKYAKVNMVNAAQVEDSSDVIMGNLPVNDIPAKVLLTLVHRIVSSRDLLLPSMILLLKCCRDRCLLTLRPAS